MCYNSHMVEGIGTLNEKPLHAALKAHYMQPGDQTEVKMDGFVIDIVRGDWLLEIQTRNVGKLKRKLAALAKTHQVRLIVPIAVEKWIVRVGIDGQSVEGRRKSPRRGTVEHLFVELVGIPHLMALPNFSVAAVLIREEEVRRQGLARNWRRRGWGTVERRLLAVVEERVFETSGDLAALLPRTLPDAFTAAQLAAALGQPSWLAHKMIYCLKVMGEIIPAGKVGRALIYRIPTPPTLPP
jgi:hypothetical protein